MLHALRNHVGERSELLHHPRQPPAHNPVSHSLSTCGLSQWFSLVIGSGVPVVEMCGTWAELSGQSHDVSTTSHARWWRYYHHHCRHRRSLPWCDKPANVHKFTMCHEMHSKTEVGYTNHLLPQNNLVICCVVKHTWEQTHYCSSCSPPLCSVLYQYHLLVVFGYIHFMVTNYFHPSTHK